MTNDNIKDIINDAHGLAKADVSGSSLRFGIEGIAMRLEQLVKDGFYVTPEAARKEISFTPFGRNLKMPVISVPGKAAIKYHVDDPELPRLAALIEVDNPGDGKPVSTVGVYIGKELLADMNIYRGKAFALAMVHRALNGAMSKLGKHRRMTANRQSREAAKKEEK